jgi:4-aminobutyrate aminotransferase / (S)-3-amino-2-methylpropionate transaminase
MLVQPTEEELSSCMKNSAPGSPNYAILSLKQGFHGRLLGSLSTSRTKAMHKVDIPAFDWPAAQNPIYKYPLAENADYNRAQDQMSLADVRAKIEQWKVEKGSEVVAVIIEPIQCEGGDNFLSAAFAQGLRDLTKELGIFMIVDEV